MKWCYKLRIAMIESELKALNKYLCDVKYKDELAIKDRDYLLGKLKKIKGA